MAFESSSPKRLSHRLEEPSPSRLLGRDMKEWERERESSDDGPTVPAIRIKPIARPKSYIQILEDFNEHHQQILSPAAEGTEENSPTTVFGESPSTWIGASATNGRLDGSSFALEEQEEDGEEQDEAQITRSGGVGLPYFGGGGAIDQKQGQRQVDLLLSSSEGMKSGEIRVGVADLFEGDTGGRDGRVVERISSQPTTPRKKEDTARRHKRFSVPAVAIQTTPVTTRANVIGEGKAKRFSLVLGRMAGVVGSHSHPDLGHGVAAGKLSELLKRNSRQVS